MNAIRAALSVFVSICAGLEKYALAFSATGDIVHRIALRHRHETSTPRTECAEISDLSRRHGELHAAHAPAEAADRPARRHANEPVNTVAARRNGLKVDRAILAGSAHRAHRIGWPRNHKLVKGIRNTILDLGKAIHGGCGKTGRTSPREDGGRRGS